MIRFPFLERYGVTAVMSDAVDGDCCSRENAEAFLVSQDIASPESLVLVDQVHGTELVDAGACDGGVEADGILSDEAGALLGIRVADCVPVLMYDPRKKVGAAVHAGRAGTFQGIAGAGVRALADRFESDPSDLVAVIGPSAGPCCYEVDAAMREEFVKNGGVSAGTCLDLWSSNRDQLVKMGVLETNIEISRICTICSGEFHSFRKTKTTWRNLAVLGLAPL